MFRRLLLLFLLTCDGSHGYLMVPGRYCTTQRFRGYIYVPESDACDRVKGLHYRTSDHGCSISLCDLPASGPVASYVYGIDVSQRSGPDSDTRFRVEIRMTRLDCDRIDGTYDGYPDFDSWIKCGLYLTERDGSDRNNVDTLVFSSDGQCQHKVATAYIWAFTTRCVKAGGTYEPNDKYAGYCGLDICLSPTVDCEPSDSWVTVQTCSNPSSSTFECLFQETTGIEKELSSEDTNGGSQSQAQSSEEGHSIAAGVSAKVGFNFIVSAEVSASLMYTFSSKLSSTSTTNFNWARSEGSRSLWRSSTTRTLMVTLKPGQSVTLEQVVGKCGFYLVHTSDFRMKDI